MRRPSDRSARSRAVITVAALYGLLLQVFLIALQPIPPAFAAEGVLCAAHESAPSDGGTPCPQQLCCLVAHVSPSLAAPVPEGQTIAVPERRAVAAAWRPAERPPVRGPPDRAVSPRGPPAV